MPLQKVMAALRNGYGLLLEHMSSFLAAELRYVDMEWDRQELYCYWVALGVHSDTADELADMNLHVAGGQLFVSVCEEVACKSVVERVSTCMIDVFEFKLFTQTRWCTIGTCCRSLVVALSCGLAVFVDFIRNHTSSSDYYISGFANVQDVVLYSCVAALCSQVMDAILLEMMSDDRLLRQLPLLESTLQEEMNWLTSLPMSVCERMVVLMDEPLSPSILRSRILEAANVGRAYLDCKCMAVL